MTVNLELTQAIMKRVQYRDVEKAWDQFITNASDSIIDDLPHPQDASGEFDSDEGMEAMDMIIDLMINRFGYKWVGFCDEQILTTDFDYAMASPGQDGKCKRLKDHAGNHDVRDEMRGM